MKRPELTVINGEDSTINRFKSFVVSHSVKLELPTDEIRLGIYELTNNTELGPIDEVEFKVKKLETDLTTESTYHINLNQTTSPKDPTVSAVWYNDDPYEPQFYDRAGKPVDDTVALSLIANLSEAEKAGNLRAVR